MLTRAGLEHRNDNRCLIPMKPVCSAFILLALLVSVCNSVHTVSAEQSPGTTPGLKQVIIGRCCANTNWCAPNSNNGCSAVYSSFIDTFAFHRESVVNTSSFRSFAQSSNFSTHQNSALLCGDQLSLCSAFAAVAPQYVPLSHTRTGEWIHGLSFCGSPTAGSYGDGLSYSMCGVPSFSPKYNTWVTAFGGFWSAAYEAYAHQVTGDVTFLLYTDAATPAYNRRSMLATSAIPHLQASQVTKVKIFLARKPHDPDAERCNTGSLVELLTDLYNNAHITEALVTCEDDSELLQTLLCSILTPEGSSYSPCVPKEHQSFLFDNSTLSLVFSVGGWLIAAVVVSAWCLVHFTKQSSGPAHALYDDISGATPLQMCCACMRRCACGHRCCRNDKSRHHRADLSHSIDTIALFEEYDEPFEERGYQRNCDL